MAVMFVEAVLKSVVVSRRLKSWITYAKWKTSTMKTIWKVVSMMNKSKCLMICTLSKSM